MVRSPSAPPIRCLEGYLQGQKSVSASDLNNVVMTECHYNCRGGSGFRYPLYKVIFQHFMVSRIFQLPQFIF